MVALLRSRRSRSDESEVAATVTGVAEVLEPVGTEIEPDDLLIEYLQAAAGPVDVDKLDLPSPALAEMRAAGIKLIVPLITQGELIGTLNLGPRLSEQEYSRDDLKLLDSLASQAAPAVRVAQLVRQQEAEARERERLAHELRVARLIQQHFLPLELPDISAWELAVHYRPAREVGGDFYDFIEFEDGRLGIVVADVTDKGVPAAMVMAAARTMLRATSQRLVEPAKVLERVNAVLVETTPPNMFVTCLYGVLDPGSGRFRFANAGHNLPVVSLGGDVAEPRATGMPLGLMPGMGYDETDVVLDPGDTLLLFSDGIVEAHGPGDEMYGFGRVRDVMSSAAGASALVDGLLTDLDGFTGADWEQEDDVTVVAVRRHGGHAQSGVLDEFALPSDAGNERIVMERVAAAVAPLGVEPTALERLKTAVAEAAMNAIEHGNGYRSELPVAVAVAADAERVTVRISDRGQPALLGDVAEPDLAAKLAGEQSPRGWGLFLIRSMVDEMNVLPEESGNTIELVHYRQGDSR